MSVPLVAACRSTGTAAAKPLRPLKAVPELGQTGATLVSQCPIPRPFTRRLPQPTPIRPVRSTATEDFYELTARAGTAEILSGMRTPIWGYNGTFPGPLFETHRGRTAVVRLRNELPVPIVRHLHGGLTPAPSDGYPLDYVLPERQVPHLHLHPGGRVHEGSWDYVYPLPQRAALLWYHDHRMDFTGPQVWRGLAGLHVHRDDEELALGLPRGDHELTLLISDRSFGPNGELIYPSLDPTLRHAPGVLADFSNGVLGDTALVNGVHAPFHEVRQGTYRLRIGIATSARHWRLALDRAPRSGEPFTLIGTDGGLMAAPQVVRSFLMAPAERIDVIVDFSGYAVGDRVVLKNLAGSGHTEDLVEFRVTGPDPLPRWQAPSKLSDIEVLRPQDAVRTRSLVFSRVPRKDRAEFHIGHSMFRADQVLADPRHGDVEIWELRSDLAHPVHVHNVAFQVLGDEGPPAWKDVVSLSSNDSVRIITRFDSFRGRYIVHCHNLEHEDMGMMANFDIR